VAVRLFVRVVRAHARVRVLRKTRRARGQTGARALAFEEKKKNVFDGATNERASLRIGGCVRDVPGRDALG